MREGGREGARERERERERERIEVKRRETELPTHAKMAITQVIISTDKPHLSTSTSTQDNHHPLHVLLQHIHTTISADKANNYLLQNCVCSFYSDKGALFLVKLDIFLLACSAGQI